MVIFNALDDGESTGDDVLERLTHFLINPSFLPSVSWTGRGKGKERKVSLSAHNQLMNFIVLTVNKIDKKYNYKKIKNEMTYSILKRAPMKFSKVNSNTQGVSHESVTKENNEAAEFPVIESVQTISAPSTSSASFTPVPMYEPPSNNYTNDHYPKYATQSITSLQPRALPINYWDGRFNPFPYSPSMPHM